MTTCLILWMPEDAAVDEVGEALAEEDEADEAGCEPVQAASSPVATTQTPAASTAALRLFRMREIMTQR